MEEKKKKDADLSTIGGRLVYARESAALSAAELAMLCGWSRPRIANYESNLRMPGPDDTMEMCKHTGASPCWIFFGADAYVRPKRKVKKKCIACNGDGFIIEDGD